MMEPEVADACPDCGGAGLIVCPECYEIIYEEGIEGYELSDTGDSEEEF